MAEFLDADSDGDADVLIDSLDGPDRLLLNDGSGKLELVNEDESFLGNTYGTLGIALGDLDKDCRLDAVQALGEVDVAEKVYLGSDTAPSVITNLENSPHGGTSRARFSCAFDPY